MKKLLYFFTLRWWKLFQSDQLSPILRYCVQVSGDAPKGIDKISSEVQGESWWRIYTDTKAHAEDVKKAFEKAYADCEVRIEPLEKGYEQVYVNGHLTPLSITQWCPECERLTYNLFYADERTLACRKCHTPTESLEKLSDKEVIKRVKTTEEGASRSRSKRSIDDFDSEWAESH